MRARATGEAKESARLDSEDCRFIVGVLRKEAQTGLSQT